MKVLALSVVLGAGRGAAQKPHNNVGLGLQSLQNRSTDLYITNYLLHTIVYPGFHVHHCLSFSLSLTRRCLLLSAVATTVLFSASWLSFFNS